ncbi:MAG: nucleoside triphosphate pyrophosphohydrolase family protein [Anaerolineales bacterium]|nr:nucleoside triphosphate pyrophosphohydrolase family protein [Anaerolineales bacterium]
MQDFNDYQDLAMSTAVYPQRGSNLAYPALGLNGEAGEVAEKVKKILRDKGGVLDDETRLALKKELGDVLWYVAAMCSEAGLRMGEVAELNISKLRDRQGRDVLHGSGDDR